MRADQLSTQQYREGIISGSTVILGRAITLIESQLDSDRAQAEELLESLLPLTGKSVRIAVSGVPGVGKSTFIESFGKYLTSQNHKVAVLAVDPTSMKSRGSILGDKTRMEDLSKDPNAFVRPTATGGHLGGVAHKTRETILLCEAAGYDVIIIETVGVGQSEISVRSMVDFVLLLMLAGAGDELQGIKKGIIEIADGIAINKADGDNIANAKRAQAELSHALHLLSSEAPKVITCSGVTKTGLDEIWKMIAAFKDQREKDGRWLDTRNEQLKQWTAESVNNIMEQQLKEYLRTRASSVNEYPPAAAKRLWQNFLSQLK
ncbi:MAG TPA: methylmalonyl Co-A mutase-associated GTPase MeaB [Cyclobacteriaceae bacterium]|nr:methylmalonyl Co-A mutase-associated GTPase MeaB [Cyclobacteriaceae bacterium]